MQKKAQKSSPLWIKCNHFTFTKTTAFAFSSGHLVYTREGVYIFACFEPSGIDRMGNDCANLDNEFVLQRPTLYICTILPAQPYISRIILVLARHFTSNDDNTRKSVNSCLVYLADFQDKLGDFGKNR